MTEILVAKDLSKTYKSGDRSLEVLKDINFTLHMGESVSIVGPSGSGKTTLLGLCAGLDKSTKGNILLLDKSMNGLSEDEKAALRNDHVGFIFQNFQLIPTLTALENVSIPLELKKASNIYQRAEELLDRVGLAKRKNHYPSQLSGGEQQRVSIARAFANDPKILFADEPTGNLDTETGLKVEKLLFDLNAEKNTTLVIVTHDLELAEKTERIIKLKAGKIIQDEKVNSLA